LHLALAGSSVQLRNPGLIKHYLLCALSGHEKKFKNDENAKIGLNEIK
jgi:hypothetical protein